MPPPTPEGDGSSAADRPSRAAGPTMSPRTAPASTDASCSGSPTRITRASSRTASSRRAIMESETMDVSSTTTTSWGRWWKRSWRKRVRFPGLNPNRRCSVDPSKTCRRSRTWGSTAMVRASACTASSRRAAALPVGAARAINGGRSPAASASPTRRARARATVVVFPVPGPPAMTENLRRTVVTAARRCRSDSSVSGKSTATPDAKAASSTPADGRPARAERSAATRTSSAQSRSRYRFDPARWRGRSSPTSGLAARRTSQSVGSGHGRATRSACVSVSVLAVTAMEARSTQTWPRRGARAANAAPRRTASSVVPPSRAKVAATWTSEVERTPARLNDCRSPALPSANVRVERVLDLPNGHEPPTPRSKRSLSDSTRPGGGRHDHTPGGG